MSKKKSIKVPHERWVELDDALGRLVPHLSSVLQDEDVFVELRILAREDGSTLTVFKTVGADGGPMVCFGSGYGAVGSLVALDRTVQGGHWRVDKPWDGNKK